MTNKEAKDLFRKTMQEMRRAKIDAENKGERPSCFMLNHDFYLRLEHGESLYGGHPFFDYDHQTILGVQYGVTENQDEDWILEKE